MAALLPLVLIHGYPLDHTMWYGVIASLGTGIRTLAPDLRGFGKAAPAEGEPAIEALAEDILELLKVEKIRWQSWIRSGSAGWRF
jgi:3-oxoadipate enol-lactonase